MFERLSHVLSAYPGFGPGLVVAVVASLALTPWIARRLRIGRGLALALALSVGTVVAATLFPDVIGWWAGTSLADNAIWSCDLERIRPSLTEILAFREATANVILFVPLGICVALLPAAFRFRAIVVALVAPLAIEFVQAALPQMDRRCQAADVADNLLGLALGIALGLTLHALRSRLDRSGAAPAERPAG